MGTWGNVLINQIKSLLLSHHQQRTCAKQLTRLTYNKYTFRHFTNNSILLYAVHTLYKAIKYKHNTNIHRVVVDVMVGI